jgi:succinate dehydrogenase / fumarate reductase cytochrome b subunit
VPLNPMSSSVPAIPKPFVLRRLHSITGLMLTIFLFEHLLTNSQAALWIGQDGAGFIRMVNVIHDLPFLQVIEWMLIGFPFLIHGYLGVKVALQARIKSLPTDGSRPSLPQYARNQAYTWQRITSWVLLLGVLLHVAHFRFIRQPVTLQNGVNSNYLVKLSMDPGLYTVADRLQVALFNPAQIEQERALLRQEQQSFNVLALTEEGSNPSAALPAPSIATQVESQHLQAFRRYAEALSDFQLSADEVVGVAQNFGTALLMTVRDSLKVWWVCLLYTLLVLSGSFHAFNGLWIFCVHWGVVLSANSQRALAHLCMASVALFAFLGLAAVWGTYWINLRT